MFVSKSKKIDDDCRRAKPRLPALNYNLTMAESTFCRCSKKLLESSRQRFPFCGLAVPNDHDPPTELPECRDILLVASLISRKFG